MDKNRGSRKMNLHFFVTTLFDTPTEFYISFYRIIFLARRGLVLKNEFLQGQGEKTECGEILADGKRAICGYTDGSLR